MIGRSSSLRYFLVPESQDIVLIICNRRGPSNSRVTRRRSARRARFDQMGSNEVEGDI